MMNRAERLKKEFKEKLEEFGSPECNMTQRRKMLQQLRDLEQEMDRLYGLDNE
jgi:transposase